MESPAVSARRVILRTVIFVILGALVLVVVLLGAQTADLGSPWGRLYRRAGDTYVQVFYLASSVGPRTLRGDPILGQSLEFYEQSAKSDPEDRLTQLSQGLVLATLGRTGDSEEVLRRALKEEQGERGRAQMRAALVAAGSAHPTPGQIEAAQQAVGDLVPGPAFLARLYLANGDQERAEQALRTGRERADSLIAPLLAVAAIWALVLLAGLIGLIALAASRKRRQGTRPAPARWGLREGLEALILFFIVQLAVSPALLLWPGLVERQPSVLFIPSVIGGLSAVAWVRLMTPGARSMGWRTRRVGRQLLIGIAAAGVMVPFVIGLEHVVQAISAQPAEQPLVPIFTEAVTWPARVALILGVAAVVPVVEETVFRGILYGAMRRRWSVGVAALASGVIFAVGHPHANLAVGHPHVGPIGLLLLYLASLLAYVASLLPYVAIGMILAWLYERTGSLVAPAAAHGAFNLLNVAALLVLFR
jgi:membrane protease YdiL (CAAX protease family)